MAGGERNTFGVIGEKEEIDGGNPGMEEDNFPNGVE
jgi:hypothetical protein